MTPDGQIARVEVEQLMMPSMTMNTQSQSANKPIETATSSVPSATIEEDIALVTSDWVTESVLNDAMDDMQVAEGPQAYDMIETVVAEDIAMDRDLSLPQEIKDLENRAFDRSAEAQHDLAALYTSGQAGVDQNYERAAFWFRQAAGQGIANAAYNLGVLYQQGLGQEQDLQRALDWYRRAAMMNHPEAQYNLGIAYIEGVGTRYNPAMAAAFFEKAAFSGIVEAAYNLGLILENGLLGEVRMDDAMVWYRAAAESGSLEALQALQNLAQSQNVPMEQAGYLESGESLANYINPLLSGIEPAAGGENTNPLFEDAREDISLGTLVPTEEQMLVAQIQEQLRKARLYNGPQDGIIGSGTVKAIRSYQRPQELTVDGKATPDLLTYMLQQGTTASQAE
jgi:TPR repeat protein